MCPVEGASIVNNDANGELKVYVDNNVCIACGACIDSCHHGVRDYEDDTEQFINDLKNGVSISLFAAPANRTNGDGIRLLAWLKRLGVKKIYDVSLGADICTWAHIRYIEREKPRAVITQPCPSIVNYILMHKQELIKYLSPIHSPMLCTAIYMNKYAGTSGGKIAALSPCIAKAHEFEATGHVHYNVTLKKLYEYIEKNGITLPAETVVFDHGDSALGQLYAMPGGLKENLEFYFGKRLRIDQAEGQDIVYEALDLYAETGDRDRPAIFDVLNCPEGCNLGTACTHERNRFQVSAIMNAGRQNVLDTFDWERYEKMFLEYDATLNINDFIRKYEPVHIRRFIASREQVENGYVSMDKLDEMDRQFDCGACGYDTCYEMARAIALGLNVPENCMLKEREEAKREHASLVKFQKVNFENVSRILHANEDIKKYSDEIIVLMKSVTEAIEGYSKMSKGISDIGRSINLISLNAAIEAKRAGEHGMAFGVVAKEVRVLANSSQDAVTRMAGISAQAESSIVTINDRVDGIYSAINDFHKDISGMYEDMKELLSE